MIMKLELFQNDDEFEAYLSVINLSMVGFFDENIVSDDFRKEIEKSFEYTKTLDDTYSITYAPWVLYALRNDKDEIVGSIAFGRDNHVFESAQFEYIAIKRESQKQGLGRILLQLALEEVKKHSDHKRAIISTNKDASSFYEKCGFSLAGILTFEEKYRRFLFSKAF